MIDGYRVEFHFALSADWFYTRVYHGDVMIASKAVCRSYRRSAKWARRRIGDHRRGREILTKPSVA